MTNHRKWTEDQFRAAVAESTTVAQVTRALHLAPSGSARSTIERWITAWELDTSHFSNLGSAWLRAKYGEPAIGHKICWRCRQERPLGAFHRRGDGHQATCKNCRRELDRARCDLCGCGREKAPQYKHCNSCRLADAPPPRLSITVAELAWVAGILEGEGCWSQRQKHPNSWWIAVRMTDKDIIDRLKIITSVGRISPARPQKDHYKMAWAWQVSVQAHREWLTVKVWPWLGQRRQAKVRDLWPGVEHAVVAQQAGHQSSKLA